MFLPYLSTLLGELTRLLPASKKVHEMSRSKLGYGLHSIVNLVNMLKGFPDAIRQNPLLPGALDSLCGNVRNLVREWIAFDSEYKGGRQNLGRIAEALYNLYRRETATLSLASSITDALKIEAAKANPEAQNNDPARFVGEALLLQAGCVYNLVRSMLCLIKADAVERISAFGHEDQVRLFKEYAEAIAEDRRELRIHSSLVVNLHAGCLVSSDVVRELIGNGYFDGNIYARGAAIFTVLNERLGEDAVKQAIQQALANGNDDNFTVDQFFAELSKVTRRSEAYLRSLVNAQSS